MHCSSLTSLKGIERISGVRELNLSSNNILSMAGIEELHSLVELNISCNKLQQIHSLHRSCRTLRTLILSHNRIINLGPLSEIAEDSRLEKLDLTDNYIGELS